MNKELYQNRIEALQKEIESNIWPESVNQIARGKIAAYQEVIKDIENETK